MRRALRALACSLAFLPAAAGTELPIEVMPIEAVDFTSGEYAVETTFTLDAADVAALVGGDLYVQGHGLGYRDGYMVDGRLVKDGKASVQINDGGWVDLANDRVAVAIPERWYGGIGGGFRTVRLTVPLSDFAPLVAGTNTIRFRFNGTDGTSSGYRILAFDVRQGEVGYIDAAQFTQADPAAWTSPRPRYALSGYDLFTARNRLKADPTEGAPTLVAACADCHARDGRDLDYYGYSNRSIVNRSVFHGLTQDEGTRIASYIRTLATGRPGNPWDPPYQPGAGLDGRVDAAHRWAAGAGLGAVLDHEMDQAGAMLSAVFPYGTDISGIAAAIRGDELPARTINLREMPVAIQLPDWNSWLPEAHPLDLFGEAEWLAGAPNATYDGLHADTTWTTAASEEFIASAGQLNDDVRLWVSEGGVAEHGGGEWRTPDGANVLDAEGRGYAIEFTKRNLAQWEAVKYWELMHEYGLETLGPTVYGENGEALSWPIGDNQSVHPVAPHIVSSNRNNFVRPADTSLVHAKQKPVKGDYDSTAWYHLQMILNAGARNVDAVEATEPVDWAYQYMHLHDVGVQAEATAEAMEELIPAGYVWEGLRYAATMMKAYQMRDNGKGPKLTGWAMRDVSPRILLGEFRGDADQDELWTQLDAYEPGLRARFAGGYLRAFLDVTNGFESSDWTRYDPDTATNMRRTWWAIEPEDELLAVYAGVGDEFAQEPFRHGESLFRAIPLLVEKGVDSRLVNELVDWAEVLWPGPDATPNDWRSLRPPRPCRVRR